MKKIFIEVDGIPPSLNSMYRVFKNRILLSEKVRSYKASLILKSDDNVRDFFDSKREFYTVEILFETPEMFRKSDGAISLTSGDIDNMCKIIIDEIFTRNNENDAKITSLKVSKSYGEVKKTKIFIEGGLLNMH